ncbi:MAG: NAD(+) synthase [Acidobacteria bacterium]|nr:NAD(+) synthase [Acidobacteriota bacterium]
MITAFSPDVLQLDAAAEADRISSAIQEQLRQLRRKGVVLGISGGIDSSVVAALCVRALGPERVLGIFMPEADSSPESARLGRVVADFLGIQTVFEDITSTLEAIGCYGRRDEAIRLVVPEYTRQYSCKIVLPGVQERTQYAIFSVVVKSPEGTETRARLTADAYRQIVAATNCKQRVRKMVEYYHADRLNFACAGTPNRLEYDLGFFVKNGDGAADLKPIAHLYKTQVYQLASFLRIPEEIQLRPPTTDTYSMEQSQEEFYFSLPLLKMDLCLYGRDHGVAPEEVAQAIELTAEQVSRVYRQIDSMRAAATYLHSPPLVIAA